MKKQRATARIAALFQQECYPESFPAAADPARFALHKCRPRSPDIISDRPRGIW
jgi:hypothetical protein